jgi:murein DD-endopeptidase MepM/ murein hydrolase activator NlpD
MPQAHSRIVAQVTQNLLPRLRLHVRNSGLRHAAVLVLPLVLTLAGVVTAFGIAPNTITDTQERTQVVEELLLPVDAMPSQAQQTYWREERIQRGDTLARVIARLRVSDAQALTFLNTAPEARGMLHLAPGRTLRAETQADGTLLTLHYQNGERLLTVTRDGGSLSANERAAALETRVVSVGGEIRSSLFAATDALNIPDAVAMQLVELFSTSIDFHKDLRRGDRFAVVYEALHEMGAPVGAGRLLSAEFVNQGRTHNVVWFETRPGQGSYYTLDGRDIRKAFLRSPLEFSRVSSGFTEARFHPILRSWTAHKGVDFVAPLGTKIKATADGVVEFAGVQSGYGNVVILRHPNKYTTLYAHMAGFAPGIQVGAKVQQGDVLGAVGMTGMTTGPHVHYEFRIDGVHHDPMSAAMPQAFPIAAELKPQFQTAAAPFARTMSLLRGATPSSFE